MGLADEHTVRLLEAVALSIRRHLIEITWHSGTRSCQVGGSLSITDVVAVLYFHCMRLDPSNPRWEDRDRLIMSKGHASAAIYAAMAEKGFFPRDRLFDSFNQVGGILEEHIDMRTPGADIPSGSLGMGLSAGSGMAWGAKRRVQGGPSPFTVFVILGDGECQEGQVWEAAMVAAHFQLDNLVAIVDCNKLQVEGPTSEVMNLEPLRSKWEAFGWSVQEIDGHDIPQIIGALEKAKDSDFEPGKPRVIIAHTVKGKGVSFMENASQWHAGHLTEEQYQLARKELWG